MVWGYIQYISSALTLVGFIAAVASYIYALKSRERERLIKSADSDDRARLVSNALEFFDVDTANLTKAQQYEVAIAQIQARSKRYNVGAIVICIVAALFATLSMYAIDQTSNRDLGPSPTTLRDQALLLGHDGVLALASSKMGKSITQQTEALNQRLRTIGLPHISFPPDPNGPNKDAEPASKFAQKVSGALSARDKSLERAFQVGWIGSIKTNSPILDFPGFDMRNFAKQAGFDPLPSGTDEQLLDQLVTRARRRR